MAETNFLFDPNDPKYNFDFGGTTGIGRQALTQTAASGVPLSESASQLSRFRTGAASHELAQRQRVLREPGLTQGARRASLAETSRETTLGESALLGDIAEQNQQAKQQAASQLAGIESSEKIAQASDITARRGQDIDYELGERQVAVTEKLADHEVDAFNKTFGLDTDKFNFTKDSWTKEFGLQSDQFDEMVRQYNTTLDFKGAELAQASYQFEKQFGLSVEQFNENIRQFNENLTFQTDMFEKEFGLNEEQFTQAKYEFEEIQKLKGDELDQRKKEFEDTYGLAVDEFGFKQSSWESEFAFTQEVQREELDIKKKYYGLEEKKYYSSLDQFEKQFGFDEQQYRESIRQFNVLATLQGSELNQRIIEFKQTFGLDEKKFEEFKQQFSQTYALDKQRADNESAAIQLQRDATFGYYDPQLGFIDGTNTLAMRELSQNIHEFNVTSELEGRRVKTIEDQVANAKEQWEKTAMGWTDPLTGVTYTGDIERADKELAIAMDAANDAAVGMWGARLRNYVDNVPDRYAEDKDWTADPYFMQEAGQYYEKLTGQSSDTMDEAWLASYVNTIRPISEQNLEEIEAQSWFQNMEPVDQEFYRTTVFPALEMVGQLGGTVDRQEDGGFNIIDPSGNILAGWDKDNNPVVIGDMGKIVDPNAPVEPTPEIGTIGTSDTGKVTVVNDEGVEEELTYDSALDDMFGIKADDIIANGAPGNKYFDKIVSDRVDAYLSGDEQFNTSTLKVDDPVYQKMMDDPRVLDGVGKRYAPEKGVKASEEIWKYDNLDNIGINGFIKYNGRLLQLRSTSRGEQSGPDNQTYTLRDLQTGKNVTVIANKKGKGIGIDQAIKTAGLNEVPVTVAPNETNNVVDTTANTLPQNPLFEQVGGEENYNRIVGELKRRGNQNPTDQDVLDYNG